MRDLFKLLPITTILSGVSAIVLGSLVVNVNDSLISQAIIQLGRCDTNDAICLIWHHIYIAVGLVVFGLVVDGIVKVAYGFRFKNKASILQNVPRKDTKQVSDIRQSNKNAPSNYVDFSQQLEMAARKIRISSQGFIFLDNIKKSPPFLGLSHTTPVIPPIYEKYIEEHFLAKEFMKDVRGGERYTVKKNDTLEALALKVYGNKKYINNIKANNGIVDLSTGQTIIFPPININNPSIPINEVLEKISIANSKWLKDKLKPLKLNLVDDEIVPLFEAIYYVAQKVRI